jgi:hypothetical protein
MSSLRIISTIAVVVAIGLTVLATTGTGWKLGHGHESAPTQRLAGWTWEGAAFF